jgi:hypothetical protein
MTYRSVWLAIVIGLVVSACGRPATRGPSPRNQNVITFEEMIGVNAQTAYEAVQRLRPDWISTRGPTALTNAEAAVPSVYLGGNRLGDIEALRNLRPDDLQALRYYEAGEAGARFGMGHSRGVIEVIMKGSGGSP